jgi:hypothetical protein
MTAHSRQAYSANWPKTSEDISRHLETYRTCTTSRRFCLRPQHFTIRPHLLYLLYSPSAHISLYLSLKGFAFQIACILLFTLPSPPRLHLHLPVFSLSLSFHFSPAIIDDPALLRDPAPCSPYSSRSKSHSSIVLSIFRLSYYALRRSSASFHTDNRPTIALSYVLPSTSPTSWKVQIADL